MNSQLNRLLITFCLFLLSACQLSKTTLMSEQQLEQLTDEQIIQFNQQSCQQQDKHNIILKHDNSLQIQLNKLTDPFPYVVNNKQINYRIYLNSQPNAWSSLNGCIRVNSSLIKILTDNEIQAVIAHEIGHIALNHSIETFHNAKSAEIKNNGEIILITPQSLSQQQELEADDYAINFLRQYNIDPNNLIRMINKLNPYQKKTNRSHPGAQIRINNLRKNINKTE